LPSLEQLFLGQNRLTSMLGLGRLGCLRVLSLQSNKITKIEGLEGVSDSLEELYLSHNQISCIPEDLHLPRLRILDVSANAIQEIPKKFGQLLPRLEEFWASDNQMADLNKQLDRFCPEIRSRLTTVYLGGTNPMASHPRYPAVVQQAFPALMQIDGTILSWD